MTPPKTSELAEAILSLKPYFRRAFFFSLVAALLILAPSAYMFEVYGRVVDSRNEHTLLMLTIVVVGAFAVMETLEWARNQVLHGAERELDRKLGDRIFNAMFTVQLRGGGASFQALSDFKTVRDSLSSAPVTAIMESPVSLVFLALLFAMSPWIGWAALVGAMLQVGVGYLNERSTQPPLVAANREAIAAQQYADNTLRNAQVIECMGMQRDIHRRWMEKQRKFLGLQALASDKAGGFQAMTKFLQVTMSSLLLGLAALLLLHQELRGGAGMMIVASILGARVLAPLVQLVTQWRTVVNVRDAWSRLSKVLEAVPAPQKGMPLPAPKGFLSVENVVAAAPGGQAPILKGVAFALKPGEVLAVVGPSASGKTTLARLLTGLWPAASGKVRLDGVDVFTWDKTELGPHVGYLPQDVELFDGTLAENIARFGKLEMAKVHEAARLVGLHEYISSMPEGYDTPLGAEGARLSGGQRQRIGLARAIYDDPVLVVLDEPNSSLDEAGDAALNTAIQALKSRGTAFVVITHRMSVLVVVDKMLILRDGQVQALGSRDEVMAMINKANAEQQQARAGEAAARPTAQPRIESTPA